MVACRFFRAIRNEMQRLTRVKAHVAQSVERVLGKDEVTGSIPVASSGRNGAWYVVSGALDCLRDSP